MKKIPKMIDEISAIFPDILHIYVYHLIKIGHVPNLYKPKTFSEKIQWIKLNQRIPIMTEMADKYFVRKHIEKILGREYLIPLIGVYEHLEDVSWENLPGTFVMKANHGSGWNIICNDNKRETRRKAEERFPLWMNTNYYWHGREWCYKDIPPRIVCEEFIGENVLDYKFFCFNGKPAFIQVDIDRQKNHTRNFYDLSWEKMDFSLKYPLSEKNIPQPEKLNEMIQVAEKVSSFLFQKKVYFVRVDLYLVEDKVYFGETTFYPGNGRELFSPQSYDRIVGDMLELPI
jgi:hypothetical protein